MTTSQILAKIEVGLGYVELGHKSIDERVSVILVKINKIKKPSIRQTELVEKLDCEEHLDELEYW